MDNLEENIINMIEMEEYEIPYNGTKHGSFGH
jgi:hypothetical protein